jgi:hypothetical protein
MIDSNSFRMYKVSYYHSSEKNGAFSFGVVSIEIATIYLNIKKYNSEHES